jgi:diguanylate cyclase
MHYFHSREDSAEILRRALQLMAPHKAAFHPLSYALWYEHAADLNPGLSRDLEKYSVPDAPLCEPDVSRLYAVHIAARDLEVFERAQSQLRARLDDTASGVANTQTATVRFTHTLESVRTKLEQPVDAATLKRLVADLLSQAQMMQRVAVEFSEKLTTHRTEVIGVVEHLQLAQTQPLRD